MLKRDCIHFDETIDMGTLIPLCLIERGIVNTCENCQDYTDKYPTVVNAHWEVKVCKTACKYTNNDLTIITCSNCGFELAANPKIYKYCPNCGAKMKTETV